MTELLSMSVILVFAILVIVVFAFVLPFMILVPGSVRFTKNTSFSSASICFTHGKIRFNEVVMKKLLFQWSYPETYTVYAKPREVSIKVVPEISKSKIIVYPKLSAYLGVDNCATYFFDARRIIVMVPNENEANILQSQLENLREAESERKCEHVPILTNS